MGCGCFRRFRFAQPTVSIVAAFQADDGFVVVANARNVLKTDFENFTKTSP